MASKNKTPNLGLNYWEELDCPKRSDFVSDNLIIDSLVGNHIKDGSLHLTADEKDRVQTPYDINTIYGTGETETFVKFNYTPKFALVFMKNAPFTKTTGSYETVNSGVATSIGTTGGVFLNQYGVTLKQSSEAENGSYYNLNNKDKEYILITFK